MKEQRMIAGLVARIFATLVAICGVAEAQEVRTYFVNDAVGSPVIASDTNANIVWNEDYLPYGSRRFNLAGSVDNSRWFTGAVQNKDTGLVYLGNRYYDPVTARFLSLDPVDVSLEDGTNFNRYWYANNNPYRYVDPDGRNPLNALDWYDFGKNTGWLIVNEGILAAAVVLGNQGVIDIATEEIRISTADAVFSTLGVVNPIPGTNRIRHAVEMAEDGIKAVRAATHWGNPGTLARHFRDHGADFGAKSADEYAGMASNFLRTSQASRLPTKIDAEGVIRAYDPKTNTFGSFNPDGTTRTFLKPTSPTYFDRQPGRAP